MQSRYILISLCMSFYTVVICNLGWQGTKGLQSGCLTEWLRWYTRNVLANCRAGSNPAAVALFLSLLTVYHINEAQFYLGLLRINSWQNIHINHLESRIVPSTSIWSPWPISSIVCIYAVLCSYIVIAINSSVISPSLYPSKKDCEGVFSIRLVRWHPLRP